MAEGIFGKIKSLFGLSTIDDDFYDELEESLILADIGVETTEELIDYLKEAEDNHEIRTPAECRQYLIKFIKDRMFTSENAYDFEKKQTALLIVGVNGVGKTTTIAKLANRYKNNGKKVILAAADTFRAGAAEQLSMWAERVGVRIIAQGDGADPAAVVYDGISAAKSQNADMLICDTAGRLHNKKDLMDELAKIYRILEKNYGDASIETLMVLDATTGQNALMQAREFSAVSALDGIILTKMDGTAKGGIAVAIESELKLPVLYICTGESLNDIKKFDSEKYVEELF